MSVDCRSCGHVIPQGQFRCGKCGAAQTRDTFDDLNPVGEVVDEEPRTSQRTAPQLAITKFDDEPRSAQRAVPEGLATKFDDEPRTSPRALPVALASKETSSTREPREATGESARDSIIPRGTFASDEPEHEDETGASAEPTPHPPPTAPSTVLPHTGKREVPDAGRPTPVRGSDPPAVATAARPRPPFLASEILHEELTPRTPGTNVLTLALRLAAALGLAVGWVGLSSAAGAFIAVGALSLLGMSFLSLGFAARAAATIAVSGVAFAMVALWRVSIVAHSEDLILAIAITTLSSALWLRAWHRGSALARGLVGGGLFAALTWISLTGTRDLLSLDWTMQSWLPALTWVLFVILCLLSLLAFMDRHTTGACDVWAGSLLVWYGVHALARDALLNGSGLDTLTALGLGEPVFAAPLSIAIAQMLATLLSRTRSNTSRLVRQAA